MDDGSGGHPPLLEAFFRENRGTVYYKAYPPYRGDDVQAIVELAPLLPPAVRFVPVPPEVPHVFDSVEVTWALRKSLKPVRDGFVPSWYPTPGDRPDEGPAPRLPEDVARERRLYDEVLNLIRESLPAEDRDRAEQELGKIRREQPALLYALEAMVPSRLYGDDVDPLSFAPLVSDEGPVLVIGRPSLFREETSGDHPRSLQQVVRSVGFPNRFDFVETRGDIFHHTRSIRDRRTNLIHLRGDDKTLEDVGFVFVGTADHRQAVIVACGTSSFGTYAAVRLLMQDRPDFREAVEAQRKTAEPSTIDIGFRAKLTRPARKLVFHAQPASQITYEPIDKKTTLGFRWTRSVTRRFGSLLDWWTAKEDLEQAITFSQSAEREPLITWTWERPNESARRKTQAVVSVEIQARGHVLGTQRLIRSGPLEPVLDRMREHLAQDRVAWANRKNKEIETFRPILILGETCTGKTIVADFIAESWQGATLQHCSEKWDRTKNAEPFDKVLKQADDDLNKLITLWPARPTTPQDVSNRFTFSPLACPTNLLDRELFGAVAGFATDCTPGPGIFVLAGTAVLFLDELLELPLEEQKRLLLVLQTGTVRPLGAVQDYKFACRLVAATNRARSIEELNRRIEQREVRADLIARFRHRYELPPLRERQEEIVPLLVGLINKRLSSDQGVSVDTVKALRMRHKAARKISSSPRLCCPT